MSVIALAFLAVTWWVFFEQGLAPAAYDAFQRPQLLLLVFAVTVLSGGFHEFGHAAAARYGGAEPGVMGAGLYLVWPAFYTDVTDSYRLGRGGRIRTDLGGLYFNALVVVLTFGWWYATGWDALLLLVATQTLQMVQQLLPLLRFDGYHLLADLAGVPDLYHRIRPTLLGLLPAPLERPRQPAAETRSPRRDHAVGADHRPDDGADAARPGRGRTAAARHRLVGRPGRRRRRGPGLAQRRPDRHRRPHPADAGRRAARDRLRPDPRPPRHCAGSKDSPAGAADPHSNESPPPSSARLLVTGLAWAWWPYPGNYRPIVPGEQNLFTSLLPTARSAPAALPPASDAAAVLPGDRSLPVVGAAQPRLAGGAPPLQATFPGGKALPTKAEPQLALVLVPSENADDNPPATPADPTQPTEPGEPTEPTEPEPWVFPFDQPLPPEDGDNQAAAYNTTDDSLTYDVAFALVWATGNEVLNVNEAHAYASCSRCVTVAVAFQVVLIMDDAQVVVPQNLAVAANYQCYRCITAAIANQLVLTVEESPGEEQLLALGAVWDRLTEFGQNITTYPLAEVAAQLDGFEAEIMAILGSAPPPAPATTSTPSSSPSATPAPSDSTEPSPTESPSTATSGEPEPSTDGTPASPEPEPSTDSTPASPEPASSPTSSSSPSPPTPTEPPPTPTPTPESTTTTPAQEATSPTPGPSSTP